MQTIGVDIANFRSDIKFYIIYLKNRAYRYCPFLDSIQIITAIQLESFDVDVAISCLIMNFIQISLESLRTDVTIMLFNKHPCDNVVGYVGYRRYDISI